MCGCFVTEHISLSVVLFECGLLVEMCDLPEFDLNYEGMFGTADKDEESCDLEIEETAVDCEKGRTVLNKMLPDINFDPVRR